MYYNLPKLLLIDRYLNSFQACTLMSNFVPYCVLTVKVLKQEKFTRDIRTEKKKKIKSIYLMKENSYFMAR